MIIDHRDYYNRGAIEAIDAIESACTGLSGFEGEWAVTLDCDKPCSFKRGDRILQCVIRWAARATDIEVESNRRGLESGSTGV